MLSRRFPFNSVTKPRRRQRHHLLVASAASSAIITSPSSDSVWLLLRRLSCSISTPRHLRQLLSHAISSGLLRDSHLPRWNSLIHSLASTSPVTSLSLFGLVRVAGVFHVDNYTFTAALKAAASLARDDACRLLHSLSLKLGFQFDTFVQNSLVHTYFACGLPDAARRVFDSTAGSVRDVISWNSLVSGYLQNDLCEEALSVFCEMVNESVPIDAVTPVSALIACGRIGAADLGSAIHALLVLKGFDFNYYLGSSLISMYAKSGAVEDARKVFDLMAERNAVCWTSMISGYTQSGRFKEAIDLFREMQMGEVKADDATLASVVSACAQLGALEQGKYIHKYCDISGAGRNVSVKNALIDMYCKCGDIGRALEVFHDLVIRDVISWTVIISGLAMNGYANEALDLFSDMEMSTHVRANEVTFLGVLSACSHGGLVDKGYFYFDRMVNVYKLEPKIEHYGCLVDLLGRAKRSEEAYKFIKTMPIKPDAVVWRSLLFSCKAKGDIKLAEYAAERILTLEPQKCGSRVLLSNTYAVVSRWNEVNMVRTAMSAESILKQPGCSFIEINGIIHEFFVADRSHKESVGIHSILHVINQHISSESYASHNQT